MGNKTQAVVVDPQVKGRFTINTFDYPVALPDQAIVRVHAVSINRGEVRYAMSAPAGHRPGWDLAGVIEQEASDGSGPRTGTRVTGIVRQGAWAEHVAVPTSQLSPIPDAVSFAQASTLPVAGLTALHALYRGGFLLGKPVLITGATGGTGDFACQLARLGGATVVALTRSPQREAAVRESGAHHVIVGDDPSEAMQFGPYPLIIDSVGGEVFTHATQMLAPGGTYVIFGTTAGSEPVLNASKFYSTGGATLYGLTVFREFAFEPASVGLGLLSSLVMEGRLRPHIALEESWKNVVEVTTALTERTYTGKAVLHLD